MGKRLQFNGDKLDRCRTCEIFDTKPIEYCENCENFGYGTGTENLYVPRKEKDMIVRTEEFICPKCENWKKEYDENCENCMYRDDNGDLNFVNFTQSKEEISDENKSYIDLVNTMKEVANSTKFRMLNDLTYCFQNYSVDIRIPLLCTIADNLLTKDEVSTFIKFYIQTNHIEA